MSIDNRHCTKDSIVCQYKILSLEIIAKLAKDFGVSLVAYEGGQGLVDWATRDYMQHPNPLFFGANRDPRMAGLYDKIYA